MKYVVPPQYYYRIHHIRPRFKNDVENVLVFMATQLVKIPQTKREEFIKEANKAIWLYPGNATKGLKTINNWRTEISSLFGLIEFDSELDEYWPSAMSHNLAEKQDLVEFFKYFLYYFQYPGGHLKPHEVCNYISAGVKFKPTKYILRLLSEAEDRTKQSFGITKAELTHCVFNDLRVTRDERPLDEVIGLILANRKQKIGYDWTGDVIRYAGDILDYMVVADLLTFQGNYYYLNKAENESIYAFLDSDVYFHRYDYLYGKPELTSRDVNVFQDDWFHYVNQLEKIDVFRTDVFNYLGIDKSKYAELKVGVLEDFYKLAETKEGVSAKEVGDLGEYLIHGHECKRLANAGKEKLIHLVVRIPSEFALGYDIQSLEEDETKRYVEVKTTISSKQLNFNTFHMTTNEWMAAESLDGRYYVYRLMVSKESVLLFMIQDPVKKYKSALLKMVPRDGADITFSESSGEWAELLLWQG